MAQGWAVVEGAGRGGTGEGMDLGGVREGAGVEEAGWAVVEEEAAEAWKGHRGVSLAA